VAAPSASGSREAQLPASGPGAVQRAASWPGEVQMPAPGPGEVQMPAPGSGEVQMPAPGPGEVQMPAPGSRFALRRRTIAIAAGALVAAVVVLAIAANRGGTTSPVDASIASGTASQPDPAREIVARANELVAQGDREAALDLLNRSRRQYPDSAQLSYAAGRIYFSKYYWTDGLKSFRDALRNDPAYRTDPELIKTVLRGFIMTPSYNDELASFLRDDIGSAAQPFLEETARDHPNAAIRSRAANELHRYH
jgi:tetratricopeptide (TPR) repeat protein